MRGLLISAGAILLGMAPLSAGPWPQWRGPEGTGISRETNLLFSWNSTNHVLWSAELPGRGHSSPVVWGDRIYLTAEVEGEILPGAKAPTHVIEGETFRHPESMGADHRQTLKVLCFSTRDGSRLWEQTVHDGRVFDDRHRKGAYASPSCATDGTNVVSYFGAEGLYCHDAAGRLRWKAPVAQFSTLGMGPGSSPVIHGGRVIVQGDQKEGEGSFLRAWDLSTGQSAWNADRRISASWSSPLLASAGGRTVLLTSGTEQLIAYDPARGTELWRAPGLTNNAVPSPIAIGNITLFTTGYPKKRALAHDTGSGMLLWEYDRGTAYVPSPVPWADHFYLMTDSGMLTCLEAATGKAIYEGERLPDPAKFTASAVAVAGRILLTAEDGRTFVIRAGPKFEVEGVNPIGEAVLASLAIADGRIYLRGEKHLFAIGSPG